MIEFSVRFVIFVLLFSACRSDPAPAAGPYEPAPLGEVSFKHTDNHIRISLSTEPDNLNPLLTKISVSRYVYEMIFQSLNTQDPGTLDPVPMLATLPEISRESNGRVTYSYVIDRKAKWPNGLPVTAADVVFSMKLALNPLTGNGGGRGYLEMVQNVVTSPSDERRFKVVTTKPYILAQEAIGGLVVFPEYAYDKELLLRQIRLRDLSDARKAERMAVDDEALIEFSAAFNLLAEDRSATSLVGSGPYALTNWDPGEQVVLTQRNDYWAEGSDHPWLAAGPDGLTFKFIPDPNTVANALRDELIDAAVGLPVTQFRNLRDDRYLLDRFTFDTVQGFKYFGVLFNQRHPLFEDGATRRALAKLVDVDALIEQLFPGGLAARVTGPVLPTRTYFNDALSPITYDLTDAQAALAQAGWLDTNGDGTVDKEINGERREMAFEFYIFPSTTSEAIGTLIAEWAAEAGVRIDVVPKDARTLYAELDKGNFATALVGQSFSASADDFTQSWSSASVPPEGSNRGGFADGEADQLMRRIRVELDAAKRLPLYERLQEIMYEDQPMVFLFSPRECIVVSRRLEYDPRATTPNLTFNDLTVVER